MDSYRVDLLPNGSRTAADLDLAAAREPLLAALSYALLPHRPVIDVTAGTDRLSIDVHDLPDEAGVAIARRALGVAILGRWGDGAVIIAPR